jgi:uncharacterized protein
MITSTALRNRAEHGDIDAQFRLGYRLAFSRVRTLRKPSEAIKWWRKAALQEHTRAQYFLGVSYDRGSGVRKNLKKAMGYYLKAAKKGHAEAQYNIGLGFRDGDGVPKNSKAAAYWLYNCALQGDADGQRDYGYCLFHGIGTDENPVEAIRWYRKAAKQGDRKAQQNLMLAKAAIPKNTPKPGFREIHKGS